MKERPLHELLGSLDHLAVKRDSLTAEQQLWSEEARLGIQQAREALGWSQSFLAANAGVTPSYVNQVESGHRKLTSDTLRKFRSALAEGEEGTHGSQNQDRKRPDGKADAQKARRNK